MKSQLKKTSDTRSIAYLIQVRRRRIIEAINEELYIFLSTFYGTHIQDGYKRVKDYKTLTMFDISSELRVRIKLIHNQNESRIKNHFKTEKKKQNDLLETLKRSQ